AREEIDVGIVGQLADGLLAQVEQVQLMVAAPIRRPHHEPVEPTAEERRRLTLGSGERREPSPRRDRRRQEPRPDALWPSRNHRQRTGQLVRHTRQRDAGADSQCQAQHGDQHADNGPSLHTDSRPRSGGGRASAIGTPPDTVASPQDKAAGTAAARRAAPRYPRGVGGPAETRARNSWRNRSEWTVIATRQFGGDFSAAGTLRRAATDAPRVTRASSSPATWEGSKATGAGSGAPPTP